MRRIWLGLVWLALGFGGHCSKADDYTRFLMEGVRMGPNAVAQEGWLSGTDKYGNPVKVALADGKTGLVGSRILSEAMGLPTLPMYPSFLDDGAKVLVTPSVVEKDVWFYGQSPIAFAQVMGHLCLNYALGFSPPRRSPKADLKTVDGNVVNTGETTVFADYSRAGRPLEDYLEHFPFSLIRGWDDAARSQFSEALGGFLSRLENVDPQTLRGIFGPVWESRRGQRRFASTDFETEMKRRVSAVRKQVNEIFRDKRLGTRRVGLLPDTKPDLKPHVGVPVPHNGSPTPVEELWTSFFGKTPMAADKVQELRMLGSQDTSHIFFVSPDMKPNLDFTGYFGGDPGAGDYPPNEDLAQKPKNFGGGSDK